MAFVFESERGLESHNFENAHLGPGRYLGVQQYKQNASYAPFLSLAERTKESDKAKQKFITPGPGQYQVTRGFDGSSNKSTGVDSNVSGARSHGAQPSAIFKSRQDRFKSFETPNPGPGSYEAENAVNRSFNVGRKNRSSPSTPEKMQILDGLRSLNSNRKITSIPNRIIKIYHDQAGDVVDINKMLEMSGVDGGGGVGPGKYEIKDTFSANKNKGSTAWAKSQDQRFKELYQGHPDVTKQLLGPGKYNVNKKMTPKYKSNPSSNFVSETVRSYYDSMYYHTANEMKAQIRKETGYKDSAPGPGQYAIENTKKAIDIKTKPLVHQYFGSTLERFKHREPEYNLAPGQYNVAKAPGKSVQRDPVVSENALKIGFQSTQQREDPQLKLAQQLSTPGVGSYDTNIGNTIKDNLVRKFHMGYKGKFGTAEERFRQPEIQEKSQLPGPGQYVVEKVGGVAGGGGGGGGGDKNACDNSFFRSATVRNPFGNVDKDIPGSGEYNVNYQSINYRQEKQKLFIENLKKIEVSRPGFDSSNERFQHYSSKPQRAKSSNISVDQMLSPQNMHIPAGNQNFSVSFLNEQTNQLLTRHQRSHTTDQNMYLKPVKQYAAPFLNNSKRIDYLQPSANPGPGKYGVGKMAAWNKRSFNIKYQTQG